MGQFWGSTEAAASQADPDQNQILCPCNDCNQPSQMFMRQKHTRCASAANKIRRLSFYNKHFYRMNSLPSHFSLPSLPNQRKTSLGFENMAWCQGRICQFWFKHLFWRFKMILPSSFMARKISYCTAASCGVCSLRGRNGADSVYWRLGTEYRSQTTS